MCYVEMYAGGKILYSLKRFHWEKEEYGSYNILSNSSFIAVVQSDLCNFFFLQFALCVSKFDINPANLPPHASLALY